MLQTVALDKQTRLDQYKSMKKKMTEEEIDDFFDEVAKLDKVWAYVMETVSVLLRTMSVTCS